MLNLPYSLVVLANNLSHFVHWHLPCVIVRSPSRCPVPLVVDLNSNMNVRMAVDKLAEDKINFGQEQKTISIVYLFYPWTLS